MTAACVAGGNTLYLGGGRFRVTADWQTSTASGSGTAVTLTPDSGYFWFFDPGNVEVVVKVLNGCGVNSRYWLFRGRPDQRPRRPDGDRHPDGPDQNLQQPAGPDVRQRPRYERLQHLLCQLGDPARSGKPRARAASPHFFTLKLIVST